MTRRIAFVPAVLLLVLAACGSADTTTTTQETTTQATTSAGDSSQEPVTVDLTADEYSFTSDLTTFEVGVPYHFVVTNTGAKEHEFMLVVPIEPGVMDMEAMDAVALAHIEEDDLQAGDTASVDYTFTSEDVGQTLEFACHLTSHYEDGMHLAITVTD